MFFFNDEEDNNGEEDIDEDIDEASLRSPVGKKTALLRWRDMICNR